MAYYVGVSLLVIRNLSLNNCTFIITTVGEINQTARLSAFTQASLGDIAKGSFL